MTKNTIDKSTRGIGLEEKYERMQTRRAGDPNPFVDPMGYQAHIDTQERAFLGMLEEQRRATR